MHHEHAIQVINQVVDRCHRNIMTEHCITPEQKNTVTKAFVLFRRLQLAEQSANDGLIYREALEQDVEDLRHLLNGILPWTTDAELTSGTARLLEMPRLIQED